MPKGKHSCLGLGKTTPNPSETSEIDGAQVPFGKGVKQTSVEQTDLLYNEYIVSFFRFFRFFVCAISSESVKWPDFDWDENM